MSLRRPATAAFALALLADGPPGRPGADAAPGGLRRPRLRAPLRVHRRGGAAPGFQHRPRARAREERRGRRRVPPAERHRAQRAMGRRQDRPGEPHLLGAAHARLRLPRAALDDSGGGRLPPGARPLPRIRRGPRGRDRRHPEPLRGARCPGGPASREAPPPAHRRRPADGDRPPPPPGGHGGSRELPRPRARRPRGGPARPRGATGAHVLLPPRDAAGARGRVRLDLQRHGPRREHRGARRPRGDAPVAAARPLVAAQRPPRGRWPLRGGGGGRHARLPLESDPAPRGDGPHRGARELAPREGGPGPLPPPHQRDPPGLHPELAPRHHLPRSPGHGAQLERPGREAVRLDGGRDRGPAPARAERARGRGGERSHEARPRRRVRAGRRDRAPQEGRHAGPCRGVGGVPLQRGGGDRRGGGLRRRHLAGKAAGRAAPAVAEDGGGGPSGRRHRPRLQQRPHRDHGLLRARSPEGQARRSGATQPRGHSCGRRQGHGLHPAGALLQPQAEELAQARGSRRGGGERRVHAPPRHRRGHPGGASALPEPLAREGRPRPAPAGAAEPRGERPRRHARGRRARHRDGQRRARPTGTRWGRSAPT